MANVSYTAFNKIVDDILGKLTTNATALGGLTAAVERDEEPAVPAERGELPKAYVIPVVEGGDQINMTMGGPQTFHETVISVVAYYLGSDATFSTDLRNTRNYGYEFVDIFRSGNYADRGQIYNAKLDVGYWISGGGFVIHYWIVKLGIKFEV